MVVTYLAAWVLLPLVLGVATGGAGLLVERLGGHRLPGPALFGVGFCALVCVTQATARLGLSGVLAPLAVGAIALGGIVMQNSRLRRAFFDRSAALLAITAFGVFAAPAMLTFTPTFLGYQTLGDASFHFALIDRLMSHGSSVAGLPPSSYSFVVDNYISSAYPTGAHTVLGAARSVVGIDVAWAFQPFLCGQATIAALALLAIVRPPLRSRGLSALAAFAAIQSSLVFSYANSEQALKELGTLICIVTAVAVARSLVSAQPSWRAGLPLAIVVGGSLGVLNLALAPWIGPLLLILFAILVMRHRRDGSRALIAECTAFVCVAGIFAIPALLQVTQFVAVTNVSLTSQVELGNLLRPLQFIQAVGTWPAPDFRQPLPADAQGATLLVGAFALAAMIGLVTAVVRRAWDILLLAAVSFIGFAAVAGRASPWAYGKALMVLAPVVVLLAAYGAAQCWQDRRRAEGLLIGVVLAVGLFATNAQTYHNVDAAPYNRLRELTEIDQRFRGTGPLLYLESDEFNKHFLRHTDPTGASEAFRPGYPVSKSAEATFGLSTDTDAWDAASITENFPLVLLRRGPTTSRPPSGYERVWQSRNYDVWRRTPGAQAPLEHVPLGDRFGAEAVPRCAQVRLLSRLARREGAELEVAMRSPSKAIPVTGAPAPSGWSVDGSDPASWRPRGPGVLDVPFRWHPGSYSVWIEASVGRPVSISLDGQEVGAVRRELSPRRTLLRVGSAVLEGRDHDLKVEVGGGSLDPRSGNGNRLIGPVYLAPTEDIPSLRRVPVSRWRSLCGQPADWIEVVR